jgi:hypothetical protein
MSENERYAWVKTYRTDPACNRVILTVFDPDTGQGRETQVSRSELEAILLNLDADAGQARRGAQNPPRRCGERHAGECTSEWPRTAGQEI